MNLLKSIDLDLINKLQDKEYRDVFFEEWSNDEVADQIRRLRKLRKLRQVDVADATGMKQSAISRIEQSEYSRWNFVTLLRIGQALDARVRVIFEPAEHVIKEYEQAEEPAISGVSAIAFRKAEAERNMQAARGRNGSHNLRASRPQPGREVLAEQFMPPRPENRLGER